MLKIIIGENMRLIKNITYSPEYNGPKLDNNLCTINFLGQTRGDEDFSLWARYFNAAFPNSNPPANVVDTQHILNKYLLKVTKATESKYTSEFIHKHTVESISFNGYIFQPSENIDGMNNIMLCVHPNYDGADLSNIAGHVFVINFQHFVKQTTATEICNFTTEWDYDVAQINNFLEITIDGIDVSTLGSTETDQNISDTNSHC